MRYNKTAVAVGMMMVGGIITVMGLARIPALPITLIIIGGGMGFVGYKLFRDRISF